MRKPILVTGSHRSGTTWVGKMISLSKDVGYIHEPFNPSQRTGISGLNLEYWFTYVKGEAPIVKENLKKTLEFKYHFRKEIKNIKNVKDILRMGRDMSKTWLMRLRNLRPLMKDPIAIMSADWLYETFDMDVIVLIRHPASFASSLKKYGWDHPFSHFLEQRKLLEDKLKPFLETIREFATDEKKDIVDQAILLWRIIYHVVKNYIEQYPCWAFLRYEDIASDPINAFGEIYDRLGLSYTESIKKTINQMSKAENPTEVSDASPMDTKRDSRSQVKIFKERLNKECIDYVKDETEDIWPFFYDESDW